MQNYLGIRIAIGFQPIMPAIEAGLSASRRGATISASIPRTAGILNSRVILWLVALAATLVVAGEAFAQRDIRLAAPPANEQRVALVIGNGAYKHTAPLVNPPNDARLMADTLVSLGFRLVGGAALVNDDKPAMEKAIREFGQRLRGGAVGLFYYAGHGVQVKGENYLIPVAANIVDESDVKYELVNAGFVLDEMANAGNRLNIMILDACRNNPFGGRGLRSAASGLAPVTAPAGTVISYATQPGNVAQDGSAKNSPYAAALAAAMRKPGRSVFETFNEVGLAVKNATGGRQQPWFATSPIEGTFHFLPGKASVSTPQEGAPAAMVDPAAVELSFWDSIKSSNNAADFREYLNQYPAGRFAGLARNRLRALESTQVATALPSTQTTPLSNRPQGAPQEAPSEGRAATQEATPQQAAPTTGKRLTPDLSIELTSISDQRSGLNGGLVTSFVIHNRSTKPFLIALNTDGAWCADFRLTDGQGGFCSACANGEHLSSLEIARPGVIGYRQDQFSLIGPMSSAQHVLTFYEYRCTSQIRNTRNLSLGGSFLIGDERKISRASISFSGIRAIER